MNASLRGAAFEDLVEHRSRQPTGECVLLADVIGADEPKPG